MTHTDKTVYTGKTQTSGGRNGTTRSSDGRLDVRLSSPSGSGTGTNPEQLFAGAWSACFISAIGKAAQRYAVELPDDVTVDAELDLVADTGGAQLKARLNVSMQGVHPDIAMVLLAAAHETCPYSKATRGNIDVAIRLV